MFGASKTNSASTGGYTLSKSLRTRASASAYLNRTPASAGNQKTWTWSSWFKRGSLSSSQCLLDQSQDATNSTQIYIQSSDSIRFFTRDGGNDCSYDTNAVFRDCSSWYHILVAVDTTQATASNRVKIYINGTLQTLTTSTNVSQNANTYVNSTNTANIARIRATTSAYLDGYLSEVHFVDGQALTPSSFGATDASTGVWQPARYTGTYGTNGFYLPFTDVATTSGSNAGLGKDFSGNGNYWNTNNISVTSGATYDSMTDVPTLTSATVANYCVWNPLSQGGFTTTNGNLTTSDPALGYKIFGSLAVSSGKWYWEVTASSGTLQMIGVGLTTSSPTQYPGQDASSWSWYQGNGGVKINNSTQTSYATYTTGDVIGIALDLDAGTLTFYKNGTSQGVAFSSLPSGNYTPIYGYYGTVDANFGQRSFAYTAPSGHLSLNTYNLPTPTIGASATTLANKYFAPVLYTGTGSSRTVTVGFQPDFTWSKARSAAYINYLFDAVRGGSKYLISNATDAEYTGDTSFNSTGFGMSSDINANGVTYASWNWKGSNTTTSNTSGSITSTVSANQTSGFSAFTFTGTGANATVGHGLGAVPTFAIFKVANGVSDWKVYSSILGNSQTIALNDTSAAFTPSSWMTATPTSTVFSISSYADLNRSGSTMLCYAFAPVAGFSAMGSYVGNGSTNGPFVYTGFRPAYILTKRSSTAGSWHIYDTTRSPYNLASVYLVSDQSSAEYSGDNQIDILSNGFKLRSSNTGTNENGTTIIYMAFAESPFKYSLGR